MTRKQILILALLGIIDIVVLTAMGYVVATSMQAQERGEMAMGSASPTPSSAIEATWTPAPTPTPYVHATSTPHPPSSEETAEMALIEREVSSLRALTWFRPVTQGILTEAQHSQRCNDMYSGEEWRDLASSLELTLTALDLIDPNTNLLSLWRRRICEAKGYYDAENDAIYVVSNSGIGALERYVYVEEFTHALQDRHFGLETLGASTTDGYIEYADGVMAISALIEGDADLVQEQYIDEFFTVEDLQELQRESERYTATDSFPSAIRQIFEFPYTYGRGFVAALYAEGGWTAVNDAYEQPPSSTEQILHPQRYLAGESPLQVTLPSIADSLGDDWNVVYDDPVGEFALRLVLESRIATSEATSATDGWGGDRCIVYSRGDTPGEILMTFHIEWDSPSEAGEFVTSYLTFAQARFGFPADSTSGSSACWFGGDTLCVDWDAQGVTIVLGPDAELVNLARGILSGD